MTWATNIEKGFHLVITSLWIETIVLKCRGMYVLLPCKYIPKYIQGCYFTLFKAACSFLYSIFLKFSSAFLKFEFSKLVQTNQNFAKTFQIYQKLFKLFKTYSVTHLNSLVIKIDIHNTTLMGPLELLIKVMTRWNLTETRNHVLADTQTWCLK